jgi:hypothetical protein
MGISYLIETTLPSTDYELLDSGDGEKLERYGDVIVARPDPQALWPKSLSKEEWNKVTAVFTRESKNAGWEFKKKIPERWKIKFGGLNFWIKPTSFKHTGLFPEQSSNWKWIQEIIAKAVAATPSNLLANWRVRGGDTDPPLTKRGQGGVSVLNLFGYTGGATLAAAQAGAEVCHLSDRRLTIPHVEEALRRVLTAVLHLGDELVGDVGFGAPHRVIRDRLDLRGQLRLALLHRSLGELRVPIQPTGDDDRHLSPMGGRPSPAR